MRYLQLFYLHGDPNNQLWTTYNRMKSYLSILIKNNKFSLNPKK